MQVVIKHGDCAENTLIFDHSTREPVTNVTKLTVMYEPGFETMATLRLLNSDNTEEDVTVFVVPNFD